MKVEEVNARGGKPPAKADKTHDTYLAALSDDKRTALESLRRSIIAAMPQAEECICYGLPSFRLHGKYLLSYGATKNHCAFYPGAIVEALVDELKDYNTSKGTIRFAPDKSLPPALVKKLVKLQIARKGGQSAGANRRRVETRRAGAREGTRA